MAEIPKSKVVNCPLTFQIHDSRLSSQNPKSTIGDWPFKILNPQLKTVPLKIPNLVLETINSQINPQM